MRGYIHLDSGLAWMKALLNRAVVQLLSKVCIRPSINAQSRAMLIYI